MDRAQKVLAGFATGLFVLMGVTTSVFANPDQAKLYKAVFGNKPKCISCHTDKVPKKADGKHDLNDYGQSLTAVQAIPDEETYKKVGKNEKAELAEE